MGQLHLIKLSVGTQSQESLRQWQLHKQITAAQKNPYHITRMWPKREKELLEQGSIYWVMKGQILCRQTFLDFEEVFDDENKRYCKMILTPELVAVTPTPKRAFQGWRYLKAPDAPRDLRSGGVKQSDLIPDEMRAALSELGVL